MRRAHLTCLGAAVALLAACGSSEVTSDRGSAGKPEAPPPGGESRAPRPLGERTAEPTGGSTTVEHRGAVLSVYVQGPTPLTETAPGSRSYQAEIVVVNRGDRPADVAEARARFEAWRGDRAIDCGSADLEGPATIGPGEAHVYSATAACDIAPGARSTHPPEVRAYLDFGADSGDLHREVHPVRVREVE